MPLRIEVELPSDFYTFAKLGQGGEDVDSDVKLSNGQSGIFNVQQGGFTFDEKDAGVLMPGLIEVTVWEDLNGNRLFSEDEPTLDDVQVDLLTGQGAFIISTTTVSGVASLPVPADTVVKARVHPPAGGLLVTKKAENSQWHACKDPARTLQGPCRWTV